MRDEEILAHWVYEKAACALDAPPGPAILLQRIVGQDRMHFGDARRVRVRSEWPNGWSVTIPRSPKNDSLCFSMGCALATIASLAQSPPTVLTRIEVERLAAAILMPGDAVRRTAAQYGARVELIAKIFVVPRAVAFARLRALGIGLSSGPYLRVGVRQTGSG